MRASAAAPWQGRGRRCSLAATPPASRPHTTIRPGHLTPPATKTAKVEFHALRHTAATLLLAEGEHPKVVQELLGHAQVSITLDRYSHMTPRLMSNAAALMDRLLDGEEPGSQPSDSS
jgi:integrase